MAQRALLQSSVWGLLLLLFSCGPNQRAIPQKQLVNAATVKTAWVAGAMQVNNKPFTGTLFTLYPGTTDTLEISSFLQGKEHGTWQKFYPTGALHERRTFTNSRKTGEYVAYWEDGKKQLHYSFAADEYEGTCREWNRAGQLILERNYEKGHEAGAQKMFYDNGKIRSNYVTIKGRRYGLLGTKNCVNAADSIFRN